MYCARCRVHFSGSGERSTCPYCDAEAQPTPAGGLADPAASGLEAAPRMDGDRTRTEQPPFRGEGSAGARWEPGTVVAGKYEVLELIGSGGFGTVYKVRHLVRKKCYALKTPHLEFSRNETFRRRFEREIEAMERFSHPDAVTIRDSGITEGLRPYYTMDLIAGESLKTVLERERRLPPSRAVQILVRVLKVLEVAHQHRIVHRDIKPENILLTQTGGREAVKVLDFGVAKLLDLVSESGGTTQGTRIGTPKYMSPEQITGDPVDARSDIFAAGIVFYEAVTGRHPFVSGSDPIRATAEILHREASPPREVAPDVPRALSDLILTMIDKRPRRRPAGAAVVLKELLELPEASVRPEVRASVELIPEARRARAVPLVLHHATAAGDRRIFLAFDERLQFGRGNQPDKGILNTWLLRCLPCRSAAQDPEAWQKNLTISHRLGSLTLDGSVVVIDAAPDSKHGIQVGGVRTQRTARIHADRFHLALGERALELDGCRILRAAPGVEHDLDCLARGRPRGIDPPSSCGYSNRACKVNSVSFFRSNNWPLHEYHWVPRLLPVGASANAGLRLLADGVEGVHAALLQEGGEAFLLALGEGVRALGVCGGDGRDLGEVEVPPQRLLPLTPGIEIMIAAARLRVDLAEESFFKTT